MRKTFIRSILSVTLLASLAAGKAHAQIGLSREYIEPPGWSIGTNVGIADLWGDVGTKSILAHYGNSSYWNKPHLMGGLFARYSAHPSFAFRIGVNYGTLYATDMWNKQLAEKASNIEADEYQRYMRNLSVRTNVWEGSFIFEIAPFRFNPESNGAMRRFQPLLLLGVGAMHFRPKAQYVDSATGRDYGYIDLYDLHLEGDGLDKRTYPGAPDKYSLWQVVVPMGVGVRWDIGRRLSLGVEWLYRYTFTDYLDNVSGKYVDRSLYDLTMPADQAHIAKQMQDKTWQINKNLDKHGPNEFRGNPNNKDSYSTFGLTFIFKVPSKKDPWWY